MSAPGRPIHLVRRFFGSLGSRRPLPADQLWVGALLEHDLARLFWAQPVADQAHGIATARRIAETASDRPDLIRAALLHDVGKRHARLGVIGRSLASMVAILRLPLRGRFAAYISHGEAGAAELHFAGADSLTVAFAHHHHGARPKGFDPADWDLLVRADNE